MSEEIKKNDLETKTSFFLKDRGERALYLAAKPSDEILTPLTRDGFEALVERCVAQYDPPLPLNDSMRSVLAQYVHHMTNEQVYSSIEKLAAVMYKSVSNALTWTIDQEVKLRRKEEMEAMQAKAQLEVAEKNKEAKIAKKAKKYRVNEKTQ